VLRDSQRQGGFGTPSKPKQEPATPKPQPILPKPE